MNTLKLGQKNDRKHMLRLQLVFLFLYMGDACFSPFLPDYFHRRNLTFTEIGIEFAVNSMIGVLFRPIWGYLTDRFLNKRKTMVISLCSNILVMIFFVKAQSFSFVMLLFIINTMFVCAAFPILDAFTYDYVDEHKELHYSNFRFMASFGYAIANLALGYVIKNKGIDFAIILYEILTIVGLLFFYSFKFEGRKSKEKISFSDIKLLLLNRKLQIFFITIFLMNAALMAGMNYMNELITHTGGDVSNLGMVWFITCIFEVVTFYFASKLIKKFGTINVFCIAIILYGTKLGVDFLCTSYVYIIAIQVIEGIAFTLYLTSSLEYLNKNTSPEIRASAMTIYAAVGGLGTFTASLFAGIMLNKINASQLYGIFSIITFVSLGFAIIIRERNMIND
jgi:MFS transporter, PPP family, 3-phenylpropionic acid transporter